MYDSDYCRRALPCEAQDEQAGIIRRTVGSDVGEVGAYAGKATIRSWVSSAA
jgi:hypothetical protein